jgi:hypothetical protein
VGIHIFNQFVFNIHSFASIFESIERLLEIRLSWTNASNHIGIGVASETLLKNSGEFGVAVGYELALFFLVG